MIEKKFLIFRYSLVEEAQDAFLAEPLPPVKGAAVLRAISEDREFIQNGVEYAFLGFKESKASPQHEFPAERFYVGKVARHGKAHVGERVPGDVVEFVEDDWIPLIAIFDVVDQYIFVQKDRKFGTDAQISGSLQAGIRGPLQEIFNYLTFVEPVTNTDGFWQVIQEHKKIYKIELELISPNILETNQAARAALQDLENVFNQSKVKTSLENESGELRAPKKLLDNYLDYISEGEGSWAVVTDSGAYGGKKRYTSKQQIATVDLVVPEQDRSARNDDVEVEIFEGTEDRKAIGKEWTDAEIAAQAFTWAAKRLRRQK